MPPRHKINIKEIFKIKQYFWYLERNLKKIANLGNLVSRLKYLIISFPKNTEAILKTTPIIAIKTNK